jgi:hypothetical protein
MAELNALIDDASERDEARHVDRRRQSAAEHFAVEAGFLRALPAETSDTRLLLACRVDHKSRVCVRQGYYSVPARYVGRRLGRRARPPGCRPEAAIGGVEGPTRLLGD